MNQLQYNIIASALGKAGADLVTLQIEAAEKIDALTNEIEKLKVQVDRKAND